MSKNRYDIFYTPEGQAVVTPHFCREYGCYGTNPEHGFTWDEARLQMVNYYKAKADYWLNDANEEIDVN